MILDPYAVSVMNLFIPVCGRNSELVRLDLILLLNSWSLSAFTGQGNLITRYWEQFAPLLNRSSNSREKFCHFVKRLASVCGFRGMGKDGVLQSRHMLVKP